jgi:hypothetical protein
MRAREFGGLWVCFFCGEQFTEPLEAGRHFGAYEEGAAACRLNRDEHGLLLLLRAAEDELRSYRAEDTELHRVIHDLRATHEVALRRSEEEGYARGLRDAQAHPEELGLVRGTMEAIEA